jgi:hypothetical protein
MSRIKNKNSTINPNDPGPYTGKEIIHPTTKELEIHKTEYIDKELPTVYYKKQRVKSMSEWDIDVIQVSGKSSNDAFDVFKKIKKEIDE